MRSHQQQEIESLLPESLSKIKMLNESFNFDWNNYHTFKPNQAKAEEIASFIENLLPPIENSERYALSQLCYKLGTYYDHIKRAPDLALKYLLIAESNLKGLLRVESWLVENELAWVKNQLAYTFYQKLAANIRANDSEGMKENSEYAYQFCNDIIIKYGSLDHLDAIKLTAFAYCVKASTESLEEDLNAAMASYKFALTLYQKHGLIDDQYARAKKCYAELLSKHNIMEAHITYSSLELYWEERQDILNPYLARFNISHANFLNKYLIEIDPGVLNKYQKAYDSLLLTDGEQSLFTKEIGKKISYLELELGKGAFDILLHDIVKQLVILPYSVRQEVIDSFLTLLSQDIPMSGKTIQQRISAGQSQLDKLNELMNKKNVFKNGPNARYIYQFPREATSGGVIPVYRNKSTGDLYVGLICNKRNLYMYNLSAGYAEAPLPIWRGKLESEPEQEIYYNRDKIKASATNTMNNVVYAAEGDWTNVTYDYTQFAEGFKADGVLLPKIDINSFHTASRECLEEIGLDLNQFPQKKVFLISYDNTVGISQGDAPGQTSNRNHQYMVYLGEFDEAPVLTPGDDVAIADWVNVNAIQRKNATEYVANEKPLCVYLLRGLESGLKEMWHFLLQQASTKNLRFGGKSAARFSSPENVAAEIEYFCDKYRMNIEGTIIANFLRYISGDLPHKTYTGKFAQTILNGLLDTTHYLMKPDVCAETFVKDMTKILAPLEARLTVYSTFSHLLHFKQVRNTPVSTDKVTPKPSVGMNKLC